MRILKSFNIIFILLLSNLSAFAATGSVCAFKFNEFLPSSYVSAMTQDKQNRIWFATSNWISSFDGYTVQPLEKPQRIAQVRPVINKLHFDNKGNLWIATLDGVYCYDPILDTYRFVLFNSADLLHKSNIVYDIAQDKDGILYFATRNGIYVLADAHSTPKLLKSFAYHENFDENRKGERIARCLQFDRQGHLWVGTEGNGLLRINLRDNTSERFSSDSFNGASLPSDFVESIHEDILGLIWVGTTAGVVMYDPMRSSFQKIPLVSSDQKLIVNSISSDNRGNVFLGTNNGLFLYERNSKRISQYVNNPMDNNSLCGNFVKYLFKDCSNALWICTQRGVSLYEDEPEFNLYQHVAGDQNALINNQIQFLVADKQRNLIYTGTQQAGLSVFKPQQKRFDNVQWGNDKQLQQKYKTMLCGYIDQNNELLIGTQNGILKYTPENGFTPFVFDSLIQTVGKEVYAILQDSIGNYYFSILDKGLFYLDTHSRHFSKITLVDESVHKEIFTNIKILHQDYKGRIWVVFRQGGLVCYDPATGERFHIHQQTHTELNSNTIWSLLETSNHKLLIGTICGISIFDLENDDFTNVKTLKGTRNHVIYGMLEDDRNDALWIATDNGIFRYKTKSGDLILFSEKDNLQGTTFNYQSSVMLNNRLYFGGDNGLNETDLNTKIENSYLPDPKVVQVKRDGMLLRKSAEHNGVLQLSVREGQTLDLFVSAFSYQKMWRNNYRYTLVGLDSTQYYVLKGSNQISLGTLPRGNYRLMLSASNSAGNWSVPHEVAYIRVSFPVWLRVSIGISVIILLLGLAVFVFIRQKRKKGTTTSPGKSASLEKKISIQSENKSDEVISTESLHCPDDRTSALLVRLDEIMEKEEPYLNKRFSKTQLAGMMRITEPQLSQLLKDYRGKGYTEYINEYRVEYFKKMIHREDFRDYTLLSIGIECGFNSKTSFYRVFKSFTGLTPSEYIENLKGSETLKED